MRRRDFIAYGSAGALAAVYLKEQVAAAQSAPAGVVSLQLNFEEIYEEMIDGEVLYGLSLRDPLTRVLRPPIRVKQGDTVSIKLTNRTRAPRQFAITGVPAAKSALIPAGGASTVTFTAPAGGSYLYHDTAQGDLGRILGIHGSFVVVPKNGRTSLGSETPFSKGQLTPAVSSVFDAMGRNARFPGDPWRPELVERERTWIFSEIDPALCKAAQQNPDIAHGGLKNRFKPRYFCLNRLSGYDSAHDYWTTPEGYIGEPCLIRVMNAGLATHAPHIHGNHVLVLTDEFSNGRPADNVLEIDTWLMKPLDRRDVLLPFEKPNEIPAAAWPPKEEKFPLFYPMHCHIEMSQTAGGGNYPQGLVTHWGLLGDKR